MLIPLIFLALALGCLAWAAFLLARRWTDLRLLDPLTIKDIKVLGTIKEGRIVFSAEHAPWKEAARA